MAPARRQTARPRDDEAATIRRFYKEYCAVVERNLSAENQIDLIDVLDQLNMVDCESVNDQKNELC